MAELLLVRLYIIILYLHFPPSRAILYYVVLKHERINSGESLPRFLARRKSAEGVSGIAEVPHRIP